MIEFGLRTNLKRIFNIGYNGHLDLRNPNFAARDNFVVDYNGKIFNPGDDGYNNAFVEIRKIIDESNN